MDKFIGFICGVLTGLLILILGTICIYVAMNSMHIEAYIYGLLCGLHGVCH